MSWVFSLNLQYLKDLPNKKNQIKLFQIQKEV